MKTFRQVLVETAAKKAQALPKLKSEHDAQQHVLKHMEHVFRFYRTKGWPHKDAREQVEHWITKANTNAYITKD